MKTLRLLATGLALTSMCLAIETAQAASTLLYVAGGFGEGKVTAYDPASNGTAIPLVTLTQPTEAFAIAFDPAARLHTQGYIGLAPIYTYQANASGNATPLSTAFGFENDDTGVAVDSKGYTYQISGSFAGGTYLSGIAPNATQPFVTIPISAFSDGITVDGDDNVVVTAFRRFTTGFEPLPNDVATALLVFAPRLEGNAPVRVIAGANTGLTTPFTHTDLTGFKVSYSKLTGRLYAGLSGGTSGSKVLVFDSHATGNTAPLRTIAGPATGLKYFIHGLAASPVSGEIFVLSRDNAQPATAAITVYPQLADGNAAPLRTITDNFGQSSDIAFTPVALASINAGGAAAAPNFTADSNFTGGNAVTWTNNVDTSLLVGITPPQSVLRSDREGNFSYKFTGLVPNSLHSVTAYFVENYFTASNKRVFTVYANGVPIAANLDVYAEAGARFKAIQRSLTVYANASGEILIQQVATKDQSKIGAIVVN